MNNQYTRPTLEFKQKKKLFIINLLKNQKYVVFFSNFLLEYISD